MYGLRNRGALVPEVAKELDNFLSVLRSVWSAEHNDDGTHADIPRPIHWLTGPWIIGGPEEVADPAYLRIPDPIKTGTYHDFNPSGLSTAIVVNVNCTTAGGVGTELILTGLQAPPVSIKYRRRMILFRNEDTGNDTILKHEDSGSIETNRFRFPNNADITLTPNASVWLLYDIKWLRWSKVG